MNTYTSFLLPSKVNKTQPLLSGNTYTLEPMAQVPTLLYTEVGALVGKRQGERTVVNKETWPLPQIIMPEVDTLANAE